MCAAGHLVKVILLHQALRHTGMYWGIFFWAWERGWGWGFVNITERNEYTNLLKYSNILIIQIIVIYSNILIYSNICHALFQQR